MKVKYNEVKTWDFMSAEGKNVEITEGDTIKVRYKNVNFSDDFVKRHPGDKLTLQVTKLFKNKMKASVVGGLHGEYVELKTSQIVSIEI